MVLQHSSWESPYFGTLAIILFNGKVGTFPQSYAIIPSFTSCFTTFYYIDPYFINNLKNTSTILSVGGNALQILLYSNE